MTNPAGAIIAGLRLCLILSRCFSFFFLMSNFCPCSVFGPSHRSQMRCPCKSSARQIDGAGGPCASQGWRTSPARGRINRPVPGVLPPGPPRHLRAGATRGGEGLAAWPLGVAHAPHPGGRVRPGGRGHTTQPNRRHGRPYSEQQSVFPLP